MLRDMKKNIIWMVVNHPHLVAHLLICQGKCSSWQLIYAAPVNFDWPDEGGFEPKVVCATLRGNISKKNWLTGFLPVKVTQSRIRNKNHHPQKSPKVSGT